MSMKVLVGIKRVLDPQVKARVKADKSGIDLTNAKMTMNPFCENAVEEAIRLRESGAIEEVVALSIGAAKSEETLRNALALGADRAILVLTEEVLEPLALAKVIKAIVEKENPDLVLVGKQAIDDECNQTGQMLSALLDWPQATFASKLELVDGTAQVTREVDAGIEVINVNMPAVISADLRLNEPRYASLPNVMKAKRKPLDKIELADLGLDTANRLTTLEVMEPPARAVGIIVETVGELVDKLRNEAKVI
jgi:electron transfer flavoprotein beta subunit